MTCDAVRDLLSEFFDGALEDGPRREVEDHLAGCGACRAEYDDLRRSLGVLHDTGPVEAADAFETGVVQTATRPIAVACAGRDALYSDLLDGAAPADRRKDFDSHLRECAGCREDYSTFVRAIGSLRAAGPVSAPIGFERVVTSTFRPALPSWILTAAAAIVVVAFGAGYLVHRAATAKVMAQLAEANRTLLARHDPDPAPPLSPAPLEEGVVAVGGRRIPVREFLDGEFAAAGLVRQGEGWMPRDLKERFDRGEALVGGRWVKVEEEIRRLAGELAAAAPTPSPSAAPTEAELLAKLDLVPYEGRHLPREYAEQLQAGRVLTRDGGWRGVDELAGEILGRHRLVEHEGRWMSEEQRAGILAAARIRNPGPLDTPVTRALDGLEIGAPAGWQGLTLYPLIAPEPAEAAWIGLHDAMADGKAELADAGLLAVRVTNGTDRDLLLLGGEILAGGRCARVIARDVLVPAKGAAEIAVFDVEPAAWRGTEKFAAESGHHLATPELRRLLTAGAGQGRVWTEAVSAKGGAPLEAYKGSLAAIAEFRARLVGLRDLDREVVGVAVACGGRVRCVEIFGAASAFRGSFERILRAAALEAIQHPESASKYPDSPAGVRQFIEASFGWRHEARPEGTLLRAGEVTAGRAVVAKDRVLHLVLYAEGAAVDAAVAVKPPRGKVVELFKELEARWKAGGVPARTAVVAELEALPLPEATPALLGRLGETDLGLRARVLEALGRRRDPAAVAPLLKTFEDAKDSPAVFPALCAALARIGDPKAVDPMLRTIEGRDGEAARVAVGALPGLLLQVRERSVLERAVGRMVDALERASADPALKTPGEPPDAGLPGELQSAIRDLAGREFETPTDVRLWWNREENRRRFLDDRTK